MSSKGKNYTRLNKNYVLFSYIQQEQRLTRNELSIYLR